MNEEKIINAKGYQQKWKQDPKGYFLIRINRIENVIEVGYCVATNNPEKIIKGDNPESIMYKIIDEGFISLMDHAAYLGKELQKAYIALQYDMEYIQDNDLKKENLSLEEE
jgi:tetrahydromethanopterin S-methyltransferase subunit A